jgi:hypothetical protein
LLFKNYNATEFFPVSLEDDDFVAGLEDYFFSFAHRALAALEILARAAADTFHPPFRPRPVFGAAPPIALIAASSAASLLATFARSLVSRISTLDCSGILSPENCFVPENCTAILRQIGLGHSLNVARCRTNRPRGDGFAYCRSVTMLAES